MEIINEIKAKVFSQYLGQKVDVSETEWYKSELKSRGRFISAELVGINKRNDSMCGAIQHNVNTQNNGMLWLNFDVFKLILKPLSVITDEDAIEVSKILTEGFDLSFKRDKLNPLYFKSKTGASIEFSKRIIYYNEYDNETGTYYFEVYQFLQSRGYDLPQYLLGGKTLQEAVLAIYE